MADLKVRPPLFRLHPIKLGHYPDAQPLFEIPHS